MKRIVLAWLAFFMSAAMAGGFARTEPPRLLVQDRSGVQLSLDTPMRDAHGAPARLGDFFEPGRAVLLVPGYWQCRTLCGTLMQGVLEAAADSGLPRSAYAIVGFSIDPSEGPADALVRQRTDLDYADAYGSRATRSGSLPPPRLQLLLDRDGHGEALARQLGYGWARADDTTANADAADRWAHAAGFAVVSPQGRVVQNFAGVRFEPRDLRAAIESASGKPGVWRGLVQGFAMVCAHFAPTEGRLDSTVMNGLRVGAVLLALGLGSWMFRNLRARRP